MNRDEWRYYSLVFPASGKQLIFSVSSAPGRHEKIPPELFFQDESDIQVDPVFHDLAAFDFGVHLGHFQAGNAPERFRGSFETCIDRFVESFR